MPLTSVGHVSLGDAVNVALSQPRSASGEARLMDHSDSGSNSLRTSPLAVSMMLIEPAGPIPLKTLGTIVRSPGAAGEPMPVGMSLSVSSGCAIDDFQTRSARPCTFIMFVVGAQRNRSALLSRVRRRDCNDVSRRFSYRDAIQDPAACAIDLVDPLTEPVAIVNRARERSSPTCYEGCSTSRWRCLPLISRSTLKVAASTTVIVPGLSAPLTSRLVRHALKLRVDPDLADAAALLGIT